MMNAKTIPCAILLLASTLAHAGDGEGKHRPKFDLNGDGVVTTQELAEHSQQMFSKMDLNGDGILTRAESDEAKAKMHEKWAERRKQRNANNHEGKKHDGKKGKGRFAMADADGDGKVTAQEFAARAAERSAKLDTDGDG